MVQTLSDRSRRMLAAFLGTLLLVMLLLLVSLNSKFVAEPPPKIITHEVRSYRPPPPPPPPPKRKQGSSGSPKPSLSRARVETPVELEVMDLVADIGAGRIGGVGAGGTGNGSGLGGGEGWEIAGLSDIDSVPMIVSAPHLKGDGSNLLGLPKEALEQNITEFVVSLYILIDENGKTYPVRIVENPFPSMNDEILKFVSGVQFTPPKKLGVPVKIIYPWDLLIKAP